MLRMSTAFCTVRTRRLAYLRVGLSREQANVHAGYTTVCLKCIAYMILRCGCIVVGVFVIHT